MRTVTIVQARMGSMRLPGKVMENLGGEPMLVHVLNRVRRAETHGEVVVATSTQSKDDIIAELCIGRGVPCFRGSENDVLDRYYHAAIEFEAEVVVRITADCPLIEPEVIDRVTRAYVSLMAKVDYVGNFFPHRTFPPGLETETMSFDTLERVWREDMNPAWREHVAAPYILHNPNIFRIHSVMNEEDLSHMRWTVDTPEDLAFVRHIYNYFGHDRFSWNEVLILLKRHPEWIEINRHVAQKVLL